MISNKMNMYSSEMTTLIHIITDVMPIGRKCMIPTSQRASIGITPSNGGCGLVESNVNVNDRLTTSFNPQNDIMEQYKDKNKKIYTLIRRKK